MSIDSLGVASVACITVICYLAALVIKQTPLNNRWIPTVCGCLGAALGLAAYYGGMVDFPACDVMTALAVGIVSGLAATGADQLVKQLKQ